MIKPIILTKNDLKIANFCHSGHDRPLLQSVLVRCRGPRVELIATDSYTLVKHSMPFIDDEFESFLVPARTLKLASKLLTKSSQLTIVQLHPDKIVLPHIDATIGYAVDESAKDYPDIDSLLQGIKHGSDGSVKLNAEYILRVAEFINSLNVSSTTIRVNDTLAPVEFIADNTYAVIMPLKA